jgi:hypothetical protein
MRILGGGFCVLALSVGCGLAQAEGIGWQEAVARLAHERTCARALKKLWIDALKGPCLKPLRGNPLSGTTFQAQLEVAT